MTLPFFKAETTFNIGCKKIRKIDTYSWCLLMACLVPTCP
jgi:hypothetical protein